MMADVRTTGSSNAEGSSRFKTSFGDDARQSKVIAICGCEKREILRRQLHLFLSVPPKKLHLGRLGFVNIGVCGGEKEGGDESPLLSAYVVDVDRDRTRLFSSAVFSSGRMSSRLTLFAFFVRSAFSSRCSVNFETTMFATGFCLRGVTVVVETQEPMRQNDSVRVQGKAEGL